MNGLILPGRQVMLVDTHVNYDPSAEQIAEFTVMAAEEMMRFGLQPKAALLSHSNYGSSNQPSAVKMREALALLQARAAWLEVDGEMHGDTALDGPYRHDLMPSSPLSGEANLLVLPNIDAANISLQPAQDGGRRRHRDRPGAARRRAAGPHPDAVGDRAPHHQHDRACRGRRQRGALTSGAWRYFSGVTRLTTGS